MSEPMTPARRAEIAAECAPIIPHPDTSGGHFSLPGAKDYIRGLWHEDGGTYYIRCPESLRPALMTMLNTFPDLLAEVARLEAENARLRQVLDRLARLGNEPYYGNSVGNEIARAAIDAAKETP